MKPWIASQAIGMDGTTAEGKIILNLPPYGIGATIFIPMVKFTLYQTYKLEGLNMFVVMSPGVVELTLSNLLELLYR